MDYKKAIEWLEVLKRRIGAFQHRELWNFEEPLDEIIELMKPLARPHGDLIDMDDIIDLEYVFRASYKLEKDDDTPLHVIVDEVPIVVEANSVEDEGTK